MNSLLSSFFALNLSDSGIFIIYSIGLSSGSQGVYLRRSPWHTGQDGLPAMADNVDDKTKSGMLRIGHLCVLPFRVDESNSERNVYLDVQSRMSYLSIRRTVITDDGLN
jgi:hypothetical protein